MQTDISQRDKVLFFLWPLVVFSHKTVRGRFVSDVSDETSASEKF